MGLGLHIYYSCYFSKICFELTVKCLKSYFYVVLNVSCGLQYVLSLYALSKQMLLNLGYLGDCPFYGWCGCLMVSSVKTISVAAFTSKGQDIDWILRVFLSKDRVNTPVGVIFLKELRQINTL